VYLLAKGFAAEAVADKYAAASRKPVECCARREGMRFALQILSLLNLLKASLNLLKARASAAKCSQHFKINLKTHFDLTFVLQDPKSPCPEASYDPKVRIVSVTFSKQLQNKLSKSMKETTAVTANGISPESPSFF
jgi:hypothetical protein